LFQLSQQKQSIAVSIQVLTEGEVSPELFVAEGRSNFGDRLTVFALNLKSVLSFAIFLEICVDKVVIIFLKVDSDALLAF
jgi:hypothetical protein